MKNEKGITLIALVVTIIVLLILAGVSLSLVAGGNGIIVKATTAVDKANDATILEEVQLIISEVTMQYYLDSTNETLAEYLAKNYSGYETASGAIIDFDENGEITYTKGKETTILVMDKNGNVEITEKITESGAILDKSAPTIKIEATTTNSITFTAIDRVGVVAYAVTETAEKPTVWTEISSITKFMETVSGKAQNKTYYVWAKDAAENVTFVTAKTINFESFTSTITWNEAIATITVNTPKIGVQYKTASENWVDYQEPILVESGTTVYFQVTDGTNIVELSSVTPILEVQINFDANSGNVGTTSKKVNYGETYGELPEPTREGYRFYGWYTGKVSSESTKITSETTVSATEAQTLYAIWLNYGSEIAEYYPNIYSSLDSNKPIELGSRGKSEYKGYDGNFDYPRSLPNLKNLGYQQIKKGFNNCEFDLKINSWILLQFIGWSRTGYRKLSDLSITFEDGTSCSIASAVDLGYVEPLVIYGSEHLFVWGTTDIGLVPNMKNFVTGGSTLDSAMFPHCLINFKLTSKSNIKAVHFESTDDFVNNGTDSWDGLYFGFFDGEFSTEPF